MAQYIDKDALVAEIIRRRKAIPKEEDDKRLKAVYGNEAFVLTDLLSFIDTLEVNEVDLDEEIEEYFKGWRTNYYSETEELLKPNDCTVEIDDVKEIAKYFFELGFKAARKG